MNGRAWTQDEIAVLKRQYPDTSSADLAAMFGKPRRSIYSKAAKLGLKKSATYMASPAACRLRRGDNPGIPYRFQKGHVPENKGLRRPGWHAGRMRETQFKKGVLSSRCAKLYKPIGSERFSKDGYLERKVTDAGRGGQRWKAVHVLLWVERYGPIPAGYAVGLIDGNKKNVAIDNLVLLSRREADYHRRQAKEHSAYASMFWLRSEDVRALARRIQAAGMQS